MFGLRFFMDEQVKKSEMRREKRALRPPLSLEALEDRLVPADFLVTGLGDGNVGNNNMGDLRYCINQSNMGGAANTIKFQVGVTGNIVTGSSLSITRPVTITGPGSLKLTVARDFAANTPKFTVVTVHPILTIRRKRPNNRA